MSFQIDLNPFDLAYAHFQSEIRQSIQRTFAEEAKRGLTQKEIAETLGVSPALVSRRLNGPGNITLRTLADLFTAMGREPLANFIVPERPLSAPETRTTTSSGILQQVVFQDDNRPSEVTFQKSFATAA